MKIFVITLIYVLSGCSVTVGDHGEDTPPEESENTNSAVSDETQSSIQETGDTDQSAKSEEQLANIQEDKDIVDNVLAEFKEEASLEPELEDVIDDLNTVNEGISSLGDSVEAGESDNSRLPTTIAVCTKLGDAVIKMNLHAQNGLISQDFANSQRQKLEKISVCKT